MVYWVTRLIGLGNRHDAPVERVAYPRIGLLAAALNVLRDCPSNCEDITFERCNLWPLASAKLQLSR